MFLRGVDEEGVPPGTMDKADTVSIRSPISRKLLKTQPDGRLVELTRHHHDGGFEEIVRRYREPLVAFAAAIVPYAIAEEVVQSSLARAHDRLLTDEREIKLKPWLFTIVRNASLNAYAAERPNGELDERLATGPSAAEEAEASERFGDFVDGILALPAKQREALLRREIDGEGYAEIAAALTTTPNGARGLIFRARTALRESLGLLIPLPLLQLLLGGGSATVPATVAGASVGGSSKLAAGAAAAVLAVGSGIAIQSDGLTGQAGGGSSPGEDSGGGGGPRDDRIDAGISQLAAKEEDVVGVEEVDEDEDEDDASAAGARARSGGGNSGAGERAARTRGGGGDGDTGGGHHGSGGGSSGPGSGSSGGDTNGPTNSLGSGGNGSFGAGGGEDTQGSGGGQTFGSGSGSGGGGGDSGDSPGSGGGDGDTSTNTA